MPVSSFVAYICADMLNLQDIGLLGLFIGTFLAATILPFSSDALYLAVLFATRNPVGCLAVGTAGNWLGSVTTYWLGRCASWEFLVKHFKISRETLEKQKKSIDRYGVWLALLSWVPVIGDVIALALGFYKAPATVTHILLLVGKFARFAIWTTAIWIF